MLIRTFGDRVGRDEQSITFGQHEFDRIIPRIIN